MAYVNIKIPGDSDKKIQRAIDLLLRLEETNMQAIIDFRDAQSVVNDRMEQAISRVEMKIAALMSSVNLSPEDQKVLNDAVARSDAHASRLEALGTMEAAPPSIPVQ